MDLRTVWPFKKFYLWGVSQGMDIVNDAYVAGMNAGYQEGYTNGHSDLKQNLLERDRDEWPEVLHAKTKQQWRYH